MGCSYLCVVVGDRLTCLHQNNYHDPNDDPISDSPNVNTAKHVTVRASDQKSHLVSHKSSDWTLGSWMKGHENEKSPFCCGRTTHDADDAEQTLRVPPAVAWMLAFFLEPPLSR